MNKIIIIGGKGSAVLLAEQMHDAITRYNAKIEIIGFAFDDEAFGSEINGFPIICKTYNAWSEYEKYKDVQFIFSLYRPDIIDERIDLRESYQIPLERYYTFIHPSACVVKSAQIGNGTVILANSVINSNTKIGNHTTINSANLIGHDSIIGDSNFFAAHVCVGSNINIGIGNFIGLNASLRNLINIGNFSIIGMGSVVTKDIEDGKIFYGNPAIERDGINNPIR